MNDLRDQGRRSLRAGAQTMPAPPASSESARRSEAPCRWTQFLLVTGGYAAALVVAAAAVAARWLLQADAGSGGAAGMAAFGDALWFLIVFAGAAMPATGAALFFLRTRPVFWRIASLVALATGATGIATLVALPVAHCATLLPAACSLLAPLRLLLAPGLALALALAGFFSPLRGCRRILLGCAACEVIVLLGALLIWLRPSA